MQINLFQEIKLLGKHSVIYSLGNFLNRSIAFLMLPIYTRFLTPTDYGVKELLGLSVDIIGILLSTAIASAIYRFYFEYESERDRNEVITTAIISVGLFSIIAILLLSLCTKFMAYYILDNSGYYYYFLIAFASMWFNSIIGIGYDYLKANKKSVQFLFVSTCKLFLALSLNIYFVAIIKLGVLGILISNLISSCLIFLILIIPIIQKIGLNFSLSKFKEMLKFGLPLIPSQLGAFVVHLSDRFFIKCYCSIAETGLYSLGYRFGMLPNHFIAQPFNQIWQPRRLELYKQTDSEKMFGRIFTYFLLLMIFAGLSISVLAKDVIKIIAEKSFWSSYQIVPLIAIASIIFNLHYHFNMGIIIQKKTKYLAYINGSNALFVLILNFILIKKYKSYGAAIATIIAFIYKVSLTYYFSNKYYKIYFEFMRIIKILLAALLTYFLTLFLSFDSVYISLIVKSLSLCLFPIILYILKFFSESEKQKISHLVGLKYRFANFK